MTRNIGSPKNSGWWLLIIGPATVFIIISLTRSSRRATPDPNDILRDTVAQGIQDNVSKLSCAVLVWSSERKFFGPWSNKPERPETAGNHQLWWSNNKIAISCKANTTIHDPNGQVSSNQMTTFVTYDGKTFQTAEIPAGSTGQMELVISKKPPSDWYENNYLQNVGWQGAGGFNDVSEATAAGVELWSTEATKDGSRLIKREFRNEMDQTGVWYYDVVQGGMLVSSKQYYKKQIQVQQSVRYVKVSGGAWFPVSVITERYNIQNGELVLQSKMEVDVNKSVFNNPSAISEDVFEIEIGPNTKVTDLTSWRTKLKMRMNDI